MQRYPHDDPYERYPLDDPHAQYDSPPRHYPGHSQASPDDSRTTPAYYDGNSPQRVTKSSSSTSSHSRGDNDYAAPGPTPPRHGDDGYHNTGGPHGCGTSQSAGGGMAYNVADYSTPGGYSTPGADYDPSVYSGVNPPGQSQIPPPPSRAFRPDGPRQPMTPYGGGGGASYDPYMGRGQNPVAGDSHSTLNPFGTPAATHSPSRSINSFGRPSSLPDDPYQSYSSNPRHGVDVGLVDPHDIEDDGDDGLNYSRRPQRASLFNRPNSDRNAKSGPKATAVGVGVGVGAGTGAAARGLMSNNGPDEAIRAFDGGAGQEKPSAWLSQQKGRSKTCKWVTIVLVFLVIVGAIAGGVIGSFVAGNKKGTGNSSATSASDDAKLNGDLNLDSKDIKALMNDPNLHRVFPGMDYTPLKTQYPDCMSDPPSQNNVTRDVAVLSQLTNKIRLYGTDCNQTEMVLHAVKQLKLEKDVKIWLGVWQDMNETTNSRQLEQMWTILDQYGAEPFEGLIIANEILFRKEMSISSLATVLGDVRKKLASKNINLPVATSDLGDDWTSELAKDSDYIMANIHPFFAGVSAETAASWTWTFWEGKDGPLWKSDKNKNIIAETGWPSAGGKNCGQAQTTSCEPGSVAGIKEMNRFMEDWVCQALTNGTQYFWFEAFDEPWKIRFNEKDKNWEDKWGLMDIDRKLKDGVKIPDCGGKTV